MKRAEIYGLEGPGGEETVNSPLADFRIEKLSELTQML